MFCILLLVLAFGCASSARILDEVSQVADASPETDEPVVAPVVAPVTVTAPDSDVAPVADPSIPADTVAPPADLPAEPEPDSTPVIAPAVSVAPPADLPDTGAAPVADPAPVTTPITKTPGVATAAPGGAAAAASSGATVASPILEHPTFSFFMHDILGGTHPSGRVVTGIVATSDANNLPFSKLNNQIFPINGGVSLNNINNFVNNNNYPFLAGLNGQQQANTILTSSSDGTSHTLALTTLFHGEHNHEIDDTISFFGVHRTATPISHIAIIGGTGKYENVKGFATIETLPHVDQHTTDGLETITHFTVYITP